MEIFQFRLTPKFPQADGCHPKAQNLCIWLHGPRGSGKSRLMWGSLQDARTHIMQPCSPSLKTLYTCLDLTNNKEMRQKEDGKGLPRIGTWRVVTVLTWNAPSSNFIAGNKQLSMEPLWHKTYLGQGNECGWVSSKFEQRILQISYIHTTK